MEALFIGLFTIIIGLALTFAGYQFFRVLIPIWGFFAGFTWGAQAIAIGLGTGFLATLFGWAAGLAIGLIIAALAYYFYQFAVGVLAGYIGYMLTGSFLLALGLDAGFFVTLLATSVGVILGIVAVAYNAPKGVLVFLTSFGGATATIAGVLVLFGVVPVGILGTGLVNAIIGQSLWWSFVWITLAIVGMVSQSVLAGAAKIEDTYYYPTGAAGVKGGKSTYKDDDIN